MIKSIHIDLKDSNLIDSPVSDQIRNTDANLLDGRELLTMQTEERILFDNVANGDEASFRKLFTLYTPLFSYIIERVTGDASLIPDYLQDTFLKIWLKRDMLSEVEQPRKWAMQIVYRICFNHLKHKKVVQRHSDIMATTASPSEKFNAIEKEIFHKETARILKVVIQQLPPQTQKIYRLSREEGMDIQQIATDLCLSNQTVKNTLSRGLKMIRRLLKEKGILVSLLYLLTWLLG